MIITITQRGTVFFENTKYMRKNIESIYLRFDKNYNLFGSMIK
jgi:hypothetical protein